MNPVTNIGLVHFLIVSFLLFGAGVATMLTKRNAIGILIGVELVLNAAAINFVAFNHYGWPEAPVIAQYSIEASQSQKIPVALVDRFVQENRSNLISAINANATSGPVQTSQEASASESQRSGEVVSADTAHVPAIHGQMFSIFIIVLAAAEAAVALAIFLNYYNTFSSIDVEAADELRG